jgi:hypothetical protein
MSPSTDVDKDALFLLRPRARSSTKDVSVCLPATLRVRGVGRDDPGDGMDAWDR